jgi:HD superfamily phosphohydrolase
MIIGRAPGGNAARQYQTDIINGAFDVDKLDYLTRDGYFTGINFSVDIDRLLPSLKVCRYGKNKERRLAVDAKGIAVLEQLLFGRLLLYDTVYHHHKVRAATQNLHRLLRAHGQTKAWKTTSRQLNSLPDFLEMDEDDFFGYSYTSEALRTAVEDLKNRRLYRRALVIMPRCLADRDSYTKLSGYWADLTNRKQPQSMRKAHSFFAKIRKQAAKYVTKALGQGKRKMSEEQIFEDIIVDVPIPPGYERIGNESLVEMSPGLVVPLSELFPFHKVVGNYNEQYKYRTYIFCPEEILNEIAYGVYRSFRDNGINLNDLALTLAHRSVGKGSAKDLLLRNRVSVLDWKDHSYTPDRDDLNY